MTTSLLQHGGGWATNIGNAFIDFGSMYALRQATEDADVQLASSFGRWIGTHMKRDVRDFALGRLADTSNLFDLASHSDSDYVVQGGTCLAEHWFETYGESLLNASDRGADIVLHGVGMTDGSYTDEEIERTREWVRELDPYALVSRDHETYKHFHDLADHAYDGIDCGFFVSDYYPDPVSFGADDFEVVNFDKRPEPDDLPLTGLEVVRPHHSFWFNFSPLEMPQMRSEYYQRENVFVSDVPTEFLDIYANSGATYADRVHACVATISYGNPARLMHDTPRALLFERVGMEAVEDELYQPDPDELADEKANQIDFLSEIL